MLAWFRHLRARIRYRSFNADLQHEIETHRALLERDLERRGSAPADARTEAARILGNVTLRREQARAVWLAPWLESIWQDGRYGVRTLGRSPAFSLTTLVTMVIGISLSTVQFSAFNAVALKPWPVENADDLVIIHQQSSDKRSSGFSLTNVEDFETRSRTLAAVGVHRGNVARVSADPAARGQITYLQYVSPGFFETTGVRIQIGRNFRPDENREGAAERVAIISHGLWQREFGGAPDVVGRPLYFGSMRFTVVGVTRPGWNGPQPYPRRRLAAVTRDAGCPAKGWAVFGGDRSVLCGRDRPLGAWCLTVASTG